MQQLLNYQLTSKIKKSKKLGSIFQSFIVLWVKRTMSGSNSVQSRVIMLRFQWKSTATSEARALKFENNLRYDFELIATKICSQNGWKWKAMPKQPYRDLHWLGELRLSMYRFFSNYSLKIIIYCVSNHERLAHVASRRSVLNCRFSALNHRMSMTCSMCIKQKLC